MENMLFRFSEKRFSGNWRAAIAAKPAFMLLAFLGLLGLGNGCKKSDTNTNNPITAVPPAKVHVAYAGGGWRAHTAHSAWTISLLKNGGRSLKDAFANVSTISSNSGGSWFSTMLMFSQHFDVAIQSPNAIASWGKIGWLGKQQKLFDAAYCHKLSGSAFLACVGAKYTNNSAGYWSKVVEQLIFRDYPISKSITLSGPRQAWASDKALIIAGTLLMNQVVLNEGSVLNEYPKRFYQACPSPSEPDIKGYDGSTCSPNATPDVTPVTFSSMPAGTSLLPPPFLPGFGADPALIHLAYAENTKNPVAKLKVLQNALSTNRVPVVMAAAASSAAVGFGAMLGVSDDEWQIAYEGCEEALSFKISQNNVEFVDATSMSLNELADNRVVRIADGGPVDNSGVAQLVKYLQWNKIADNFNIVAFDNVQQLYQPKGPGAAIGMNLASLFTTICEGKFCSDAGCTGTCVTIPGLQVFEPNALQGTPVTWSESNGQTTGVHKVVYTKYSVTTVSNAAFGIKAGTKGTLHAFSCGWSEADTGPQNKTQDGDFIAYNAMLQFIHSALQKNNGQGQAHLERAFGLIQ